MENMFPLNPNITVVADARLGNPTAQAFWRSFFLGTGQLTVVPGPEYTFRLGDTPIPTLPEEKEYALAVDKNGAAIVGKD